MEVTKPCLKCGNDDCPGSYIDQTGSILSDRKEKNEGLRTPEGVTEKKANESDFAVRLPCYASLNYK